jgi:hypothetical protein
MRQTQSQVLERLEQESVRAFDKMVDAGSAELHTHWEQTKTWLKMLIRHEYAQDFRRDAWNLMDAHRLGTFERIRKKAYELLNRFHEESLVLAEGHFKTLRRESVLRNAWMLDQVTPPSQRVVLPLGFTMREAKVYEETQWNDRWGAWLTSYQASLNNNLRMGAMNNSNVNDAADEVDATRPGSPSADMWSALDRIYQHESTSIYASSQLDVSKVNDQFNLTEVWQTRYYKRVCDLCEGNRGLTREEASDDIPAHPNCNCFWRIVPATWAQLMRSGNLDEREIAKAMDAADEVPDMMLVLNDKGELVGAATVEFGDWIQDKMKVIVGG